jgi:hypothetical protein
MPLSSDAPFSSTRHNLITHDMNYDSDSFQYPPPINDERPRNTLPSPRPESIHYDTNYDSDSFVLPPPIHDRFRDGAPEQLENEDLSSDHEENQQVSRERNKPGRKVDSTFPFPALGEFAHPFEGWVLDKAAMYAYMPNYTKQEGFTVNPHQERGHVIRWRCIHGGKYGNTHNLPSEVTEKNHRDEVKASGKRLIPNANARSTDSTATWPQARQPEARLSILHFVCCIRRQ